jgi:hypothetical protein
VVVITLTILIQIRDPGYEIRRLFDPRIWDPGWVKNQDSDWGSKMNNPDHISESLETIFWVKIFLMRFKDGKNSDPGRKKFGSGIRDKHPGSSTLSISSPLSLGEA